ncbi:MAG: RodZ domain-containing protein [Marmoricola sp.]
MSTQTHARSHSSGFFDGEDADAVAVRRNVLLSGVVGGLAMLLGLAYLLRSASAFDVIIGLLMVLVASWHLPALASARVPVVVADDHGLRLRIGHTWRGLPWSSVRQVVVEYADSPLREGRLVVVLRDPARLLDGLGPLAQAHLRWNHLWYGAPLAIPLGMTTIADSTDLAADLELHAAGRTEVVNLRGRELANLDEVPARPRPEPASEQLAAPSWLPDAVTVTEPDAVTVTEPDDLELDHQEPDDEPLAASWDDHDHDPESDSDPELVQAELPAPPEPLEDEPQEQLLVHVVEVEELPAPPEPLLPEPVAPLRALHRPSRVDVRIDPPAADPNTGPTSDLAASGIPEQRSAMDADLEEFPVDVEVLIDDFADPVVPAPVPVIGPKIVHAREMLDMSIDELSQRTRIRPHVLEAIEVDDFGPCGGDFYARGHLTAVARVLGLTLEPLMKTYDERYAQAPINARRVFEAELSSGLSGGMRATLGGPRWSLLIGSVLMLTMVWGLARLFAGDPQQLTVAPDASSQTAGLAANQKPITSPLMKTTTMTVTAAHAGTRVVVRDRTQKVLWSGDLALGKHRTIVGVAPFKVTADNAGAVEVSVKGKPKGTIGTAGTKGTRSFR